MIQDRTAHQMTRESGLTVTFERGGQTRIWSVAKSAYVPTRELKRGYWITGGAYLGEDSAQARKTLASVLALVQLTSTNAGE